MRVQPVAEQVWMFVGDDHESVATAFIDGDDALLVDALGRTDDALRLRQLLCEERGKTVRAIVATHCMSDHMAALPLFPQALRIAQRHYRHTFLHQNRREDAYYLEPQLVFDHAMSLRWGAHELRLLHNPGKTLDHISVDVPSADLVCAGDNIVGRIVYLSRADPMALRAAILRLREFGRGSVIGGHIGCFPAVVLDQALHYLDRLRDTVVGIRASATSRQADARIAAIPIEACLAPQVQALAFERDWHARNLEAIVAQSVFALDAAMALREARA
ncbi:MBL fold metallo-hydrolase [Lysobacter sp. 5GHs7-4]|uniref:MBL fold metallo-hydrolase n=1 Tax=Lysobacter sp. 5GHs7-4 TaxID=2904253 RepID=UPI001E2A57A8|nr:MBL fold metallo-hydrolase [Lysobacter sp. 5GHs7-4]UHQ21861.1 MBL fold metallo-hydrolase [Lysobacter sp. 5GHs7-4]